MSKLTRVCTCLSHTCQLLVPLQLHHVCCRRLVSSSSGHQRSQSVVLIQSLLFLSLCKTSVVDSATV